MRILLVTDIGEFGDIGFAAENRAGI